MFSATTRAHCAIGLLATTSIALFVTGYAAPLSDRADRTVTTAAATLAIITAIAGCTRWTAAQRERLRKAYEADRDILVRTAVRASQPHGGDGGQAPQQRQAWVRYLKEPA